MRDKKFSKIFAALKKTPDPAVHTSLSMYLETGSLADFQRLEEDYAFLVYQSEVPQVDYFAKIDQVRDDSLTRLTIIQDHFE